MAEWIKLTHHYDHRWPSGAVTAFDAGQVVHVKDEVAEAAIAAGAAKKTGKPKEGKDGHVTTPTRLEGSRRARTGERLRSIEVKTGGHGYDNSGNPVTAEAASLPDASDPKAKRAEPLVGAITAGVPASAQEEAEKQAEEEAAEQPGTVTANQLEVADQPNAGATTE